MTLVNTTVRPFATLLRKELVALLPLSLLGFALISGDLKLNV
jgi:hypothetical protein